jgi:2-phospho-L-lactate guanylyltransferase (CobY/MobA/RfbA family)
MRRTGDDGGAVRLTTMVWLVVVLAVLGVGGYDTASIVSTRVNTENDAQTAAYAASASWHANSNLDEAYQAAVTSLAGKNDTVLTHHFVVDADGTVHLLVRHRAHSILLGHISSLRHLDVALEQGDANSING